VKIPGTIFADSSGYLRKLQKPGANPTTFRIYNDSGPERFFQIRRQYLFSERSRKATTGNFFTALAL
jgi:hypothetical protein